MAEDIDKKLDQSEVLDLGDHTSSNTSKDAVISGDRKEHQKIFNDAVELGRTFGTFSDNKEDQSFQSLLPGETVEQYQIRLDERQKQKAEMPKIDSFGIDFGDGTLETAKGKIPKSTLLENRESGNLISQKIEPPDLIEKLGKSNDTAENILNKWNSAKPLTLKEFLSLATGVSPVVDAYRKSLAASNDEPYKSPTLEHVFFRLQNCPWSDEIKILRNVSNANKDYNPATMTIEIGGTLSAPRQIETFAHEAFHASHRDLFNLYLNPDLKEKEGGIATLDEYRNARFGAEVKAFETEIKIHLELTSKMEGSNPITMAIVKKGPIANLQIHNFWEKDTIDRPDLCRLYEKEKFSGLWKFLRDAKPLRLDAQGKAIHQGEGYQTETTYGERYDKQYTDWYVPNFKAEKLIAE